MGMTSVRMAGTFFSVVCALMLIGCGPSDDSSGGGGFTPVTVASVGEFQGELATLADRQFARVALRDGVDVNMPIVLDGADLDVINEGQWLSIQSANREGWPVLLLQPTREQIETLIGNLDLDLEAPEDIEGLDAIGYQRTDVGDIEAVFEYVNTDADPDRDVRVAAIGDWVADRQFPAVSEAPELASTAGQAGSTPELEDLMGALSRQASLVVDQATHVVVVDAWAAHEYATGNDFYIFGLNSRSSGRNYQTRAYAMTRRDGGIIRSQKKSGTAAANICMKAADLTSCVRDHYLRQFEVTLFAVHPPEVAALVLARASPSTARESNSYMVSTDLSIGGSVNAGFSKEEGPNASVGLTHGLSVNHTRTVEIKDAVIVADHHAINGSSASWRLEMPDPGVEDRERPFKPGRLLREPFLIQQGTHTSEQWAVYRVPASARASLNNKLRINLRIQAGEGMSTLDWVHNAFDATAPGCASFGGNCRPEVVHYPLNTGGSTFTYPLADDGSKEPELPQLSSLSRTAGSGGDLITLQGTGLRRTTAVFFGTVRADVFAPVGDARIQVSVPKNEVRGNVNVYVQSGGFLSNALQFTYN